MLIHRPINRLGQLILKARRPAADNSNRVHNAGPGEGFNRKGCSLSGIRLATSGLTAAVAMIAVGAFAAGTAQAKTIDCRGLVTPGAITVRVTVSGMTCKAAKPLYRRVTSRESLDGPFRFQGHRWLGHTGDKTGKVHYWQTTSGPRMRLTVYTRVGVS